MSCSPIKINFSHQDNSGLKKINSENYKKLEQIMKNYNFFLSHISKDLYAEFKVVKAKLEEAHKISDLLGDSIKELDDKTNKLAAGIFGLIAEIFNKLQMFSDNSGYKTLFDKGLVLCLNASDPEENITAICRIFNDLKCNMDSFLVNNRKLVADASILSQQLKETYSKVLCVLSTAVPRNIPSIERLLVISKKVCIHQLLDICDKFYITSEIVTKSTLTFDNRLLESSERMFAPNITFWNSIANQYKSYKKEFFADRNSYSYVTRKVHNCFMSCLKQLTSCFNLGSELKAEKDLQEVFYKTKAHLIQFFYNLSGLSICAEKNEKIYKDHVLKLVADYTNLVTALDTLLQSWQKSGQPPQILEKLINLNKNLSVFQFLKGLSLEDLTPQKVEFIKSFMYLLNSPVGRNQRVTSNDQKFFLEILGEMHNFVKHEFNTAIFSNIEYPLNGVIKQKCMEVFRPEFERFQKGLQVWKETVVSNYSPEALLRGPALKIGEAGVKSNEIPKIRIKDFLKGCFVLNEHRMKYHWDILAAKITGIDNECDRLALSNWVKDLEQRVESLYTIIESNITFLVHPLFLTENMDFDKMECEQNFQHQSAAQVAAIRGIPSVVAQFRGQVQLRTTSSSVHAVLPGVAILDPPIMPISAELQAEIERKLAQNEKELASIFNDIGEMDNARQLNYESFHQGFLLGGFSPYDEHDKKKNKRA